MNKSTFRRLRAALRRGVREARRAWQPDSYVDGPFEALSAEMLDASRTIRGADCAPAILVHGVMPRSGTVYFGRLLAAHPDVESYPNLIWEMPLLHCAKQIGDLQSDFIAKYPQNEERFAQHDFACLIGSAFIGYLHAQMTPGKRLLMKVPLATHLAQFALMFPHEKCLMLLRDGRDLVASTMKSWPGRDFERVVADWRDAAHHMLSLDYPLYRYEDLVADPSGVLKSVFSATGLDPDTYRFDEIADHPLRGSSDYVDSHGWDHVDKPKEFRSVERWKSWSPRQKERFKRIAGDVLVEAGYVADHGW